MSVPFSDQIDGSCGSLGQQFTVHASLVHKSHGTLDYRARFNSAEPQADFLQPVTQNLSQTLCCIQKPVPQVSGRRDYQFPGFAAWVVLFVGVIVILDRLVFDRAARRAFRWRDKTS